MIERDHSGSISSREMKQVFRALEIQASDTEIQQIIKQMDTDGNNEISFEEFARVNFLNYC
jgi:calmodulin